MMGASMVPRARSRPDAPWMRLSVRMAAVTRGLACAGLRGIERRLAAFDGVLAISSPPGGPTAATMEIPCELSSPEHLPPRDRFWTRRAAICPPGPRDL